MDVKLSIIVPIYNVEKYLSDCLESILKQNFDGMEIICVNDGSTDKSESILEEYKKKYSIVKSFNKENGGQSSARNLGLKKSKGKYVVFLDGDDIWINKNVASYIVTSMEKENLDMLVFGIEPFFENENLKKRFSTSKGYYHVQKSYGFFEHGYEMLKALREGHDYLSSVCVRATRRDVLIGSRLKFYEGIVHEDDLFTFLLLMNVGKCRHVDKIFYGRRYRPDSTMTKKISFRNFHGYFTVWKEVFTWLSENHIPKEAENIAEEMLWSFENLLRNRYRDIEQEEQKKTENYSVADRYLLSRFLLNTASTCSNKNSFTFPYHLVPLKSRIVLYGAGDLGWHMWRQIQTEHMVTSVAIVDRNADKINRHNVYPVNDLSRLVFDYIVIAIKDAGTAKKAKRFLLDMGIKEKVIKWDGDNYNVDNFHRNVVGPLLGRI